MKILIATTQAPFISGGAEIQALSLQKNLIQRGHEAELLTLPFRGYPEDLIGAIPYVRLLELTHIHGHKVDRLIGLKYPTYLIPHPHKVIWLIHQHRDAYDLWESGHSSLRSHPAGLAFRDAVIESDRISFKESKKIFAESRNVAQRLKKFNGVEAPSLYHPPQNEDRFFCEKPDPYLFFPSRITHLKRQLLVCQALAKTKNPVRLILAGTADIPTYLDEIKIFIKAMNLEDRIHFRGKITEEDKIQLYAKSLAVVYPPYDEDYGYVTLEAMLSQKATITCTDSGGPLEFIKHRETGWIVPPDPESLAHAFDEAWENAHATARKGIAGLDYYRSLGISWDKVVDSLCS